jgi:hypothetical protein
MPAAQPAMTYQPVQATPAGMTPAMATAAPGAAPASVAAAEAAARAAADQMVVRGRAWWGQLDPTNRRPTIYVAIAIIALVIGSQFLNALVPIPRGGVGGGGGGGGGGGQPGLGNPVDIGNGVRVTPPAGWVPVGNPTGLPGLKFQKGPILVEVGIASFTSSPKDLLVAYVNQILAPSAQDAKVSAAQTGTAGNGRPTARATYTGSFKEFGTAVEGELSTQVVTVGNTGIGIVVNAYGPQGTLAGSLTDVHTFVDTIEVGQ